MRRWIMMGLALGLSASAQANVKCSNASQTVSYSLSHYFGGAAPPRGVSLTSEAWKIDGVDYVQSKMLDNVTPAGLKVTWVETGVTLGEPRTSNSSHWAEQDDVRYATVESKDGAVLFEGHLICTTYTWQGPPPP